MDIHEYQAKEILSGFGVRIPPGGLAYSPEQAAYRAREIGGSKWVVKAQVHTGARGKAGGVKLCSSEQEVFDAANGLFGKRLVTQQTGSQGKIVYRVYVEGAVAIERELYLGFVLDRSSERIMVVASASGGMEIEEISANQPESILRTVIEPAVGIRDFQAREIAFGLGIDPAHIQEAASNIKGSYRAFRDLDATMVEINPLVVVESGSIVALDAKMSFDDNALFRRPEISELRDKSQEDPRETQAADRGLSYVGLEGKIGCIVNGAGLAMATMDIIKHSGGEPANFLDVGGGADEEQIENAFRILVSDNKVKAIFINIFGGILRCDILAAGVVAAAKKIGIKIPVVVRMEGTNMEEGHQILEKSGLNFIIGNGMKDGAKKAVQAIQ